MTLTFIFLLVLSGCGINSSPEGRMSLRLETLQKELIDSLKLQNKAILDSLGKIREDLKKMQERMK